MKKELDLDKVLGTLEKSKVLMNTKKVVDDASERLGKESIEVLTSLFEIIESVTDVIPELHKPLTDSLYDSCGYEIHTDMNGEFYDAVFKYKEGHVYNHIHDVISKPEDSDNYVRLTRNNSIYITPRIKKVLKSYSKDKNYDLSKAVIPGNLFPSMADDFLDEHFFNLEYLVSCEENNNQRIITYAETIGEAHSTISLVQYKLIILEDRIKFEKVDTVTLEHKNIDNIIKRLI